MKALCVFEKLHFEGHMFGHFTGPLGMFPAKINTITNATRGLIKKAMMTFSGLVDYYLNKLTKKSQYNIVV